MKKTLAAVIAAVIVLCTIPPITFVKAQSTPQAMEITAMKVNSLTTPIGIDTNPVFSWVLDAEGYNRSQSAYRIFVSTTYENALNGIGDMWDSGKIASENNYDVTYEGTALSSLCEYFWRVDVFDESDALHSSEVSTFETGFLSESEWVGQWIDAGIEEILNFDDCRWIWADEDQYWVPAGTKYFRFAFTPDENKTVEKVYIACTGDDTITAYLNGEEIGSSTIWTDGIIADTTAKILTGKNVLAAKVTNTTGGTGAYAAYIAKIQIHYTDGTFDAYASNSTWKLFESEAENWTAVDFDDSSWLRSTDVGASTVSPWKNVEVDTSKIAEAVGSPMLRKEFSVSKEVKKARMYISGLGLFELKINGILPDDTVLNPVNTQYEDTVHYRVFDVTSLISSGDNAIAVELGNYFYNENYSRWNTKNAVWRDQPKLIAELHITYSDGTKDIIKSDTSWKVTTDGPRIFDSIYFGEHYDSRKEIADWDKAGFDDSLWDNAALAKKPGTLVFENMEPMRRIDTLTKTVSRLASGTYIIKAPVMTTGWAKITFPATVKDEEITIVFGETLKADGRVQPVSWGDAAGKFQTYKYICSGNSNEVFEPKFSYVGYLYIEVSGYTGTLTESDIECYLIASDVENVSTFESSNELINTLHENMLRTTINNLQGKPTDCPTWEKLGWLGDYDAVVRSIMFNYGVSAFNDNFMDTIRDAAKGSKLPNFAPVAEDFGNTVIWNAAYIDSIYEAWNYYGTLTLAKDHYDKMREVALSYIDIIKVNNWVWPHSGSLNDWQGPDGPSSSPEGSGIISTAYVYGTLGYLAEMADALDKTQDASEYRGYREIIYAAFNTAFYNEEKGYYETGYWNASWAGTRSEYRQTSNLVPIAYGLCPDDKLESVLESLVDHIISEDYHLEAGHVGTKLILPVLSENGYGDVAYKLITQTTYPSWGYWVSQGATSLWEGYPVQGTRSRNHYFLGSYDQWLFENLAGFDQFSEGFRTITVRPQLLGDLTYVNSSVNTVRGTLSSAWKKYDSSTAEFNIKVPVGSTATIYLPASAIENIRVNGVTLDKQAGITSFELVDDEVIITACSGEYTFISSTSLTGDTATLKSEVDALILEGSTLFETNYPADLWQDFTVTLTKAKALVALEYTEAELLVIKLQLTEELSTLKANKKGNLALGASVEALGSITSPKRWADPSKLVDGDRNNIVNGEHTGWSCAKWYSENYVIIDLGGVYNINTVDVYPTGQNDVSNLCSCFPKAYEILISTDKEAWTTVDAKSDLAIPQADENNNSPVYSSTFKTQEARYVKVNVSAFHDTYGQFAEIEVYRQSDEHLEYLALLEMAEGLNANDYREDAFSSFTASLNAIKAEADESIALSKLKAAFNELNKYTIFNIALNKTVTSSASLGVAAWGDTSKLTDGDTLHYSSSANQNQGWSSQYGASSVYIDIDLGNTYSFNTVNLYPTGSYGANSICMWYPKSYMIQVSDDGDSWNTVYTATAVPQPYSDENNVPPVQVHQFTTVSARYVRIQVTELNERQLTAWGSYEQYAQFAEIEVFNQASYELTVLIEKADKLESSKYYKENWADFEAVLNSAKEVNISGNENEKVLWTEKLNNALIQINKHRSGNLANGMTVTSTSSLGSASWKDITKLTDGSRNNKNGSENQGWSGGHSVSDIKIDIDLGGIYSFNTVDLYATGATGPNAICRWFPKSYLIQVSTDGSDWKTVYTATNVPQPYSDADGNNPLIRHGFETISARYVRIHVTELNEKYKTPWNSIDQYAQLSEIEVYNLRNSIVGATLEIGSSLTVNYYADLIDINNDAIMRFTRGNSTVEVTGKFDKATGYYVFDYTGINPQCMSDTIKAELIINGNTVSVKDGYSVKAYCANVYARTAAQLGISEEKYSSLITLISDMLIYGDASQDYQNYKTDSYASADFDWLKPSAFTVPSGTRIITGNSDTLNKVVSIGLNMSNTNRIYFRLTLNDESVEIRLNGNTVSRSSLINGVLYSDSIKATEFDNVYTLELVRGDEVISTLNYNVNAYIQQKHESTSVGALVRALCNYGTSASNYSLIA